jgi:hypothetical protein
LVIEVALILIEGDLHGSVLVLDGAEVETLGGGEGKFVLTHSPSEIVNHSQLLWQLFLMYSLTCENRENPNH